MTKQFLHEGSIQYHALKCLDSKLSGKASAYDLKISTGFAVSIRTMRALESREWVTPTGEHGYLAPQNADYRITEAGRDAIKEAEFLL